MSSTLSIGGGHKIWKERQLISKNNKSKCVCVFVLVHVCRQVCVFVTNSVFWLNFGNAKIRSKETVARSAGILTSVY